MTPTSESKDARAFAGGYLGTGAWLGRDPRQHDRTRWNTNSFGPGVGLVHLAPHPVGGWRHSGEKFAQWVRGLRPKLAVEVVKRSDDTAGFTVLPRRWVLERTSSAG
jgi:hypothetical protein